MRNRFEPAHAAVTALLLIASLVTTGCLSQLIPEAPPPAATFDFGPLPEERPAPLPLRFAVESVTAPSWLETADIHYRRLDEQPGALRAYGRNQWIAATTELLSQRLRDRLAGAAPESPAAPLPLRVELVSFEHVYTSLNDAYVVARARASYEDLDGRTRQREFERRRPAEAAVQGATVELPHVADELIDAMLEWLRRSAGVGDG